MPALGMYDSDPKIYSEFLLKTFYFILFDIVALLLYV